MAENKEFLGITQNECTIQGKVVGDPVVQENFAAMTVRTSVSEQDANGQWSDTQVDVPVYTMDTNKIRVISDYVKDGRELLCLCYYKSWQTQQGAGHGFFLKKVTLGRKKWVPPKDENPGFQAPPLQ